MTKIIILLSLIAFQAQADHKFKKQKRKVSSAASLLSEISEHEQKLTVKLNSIINSVKPAKLQNGSPDYNGTSKSINSAIKKILLIAKTNPKSDVAQLYKSSVEHIPLFKGFVYRLRKIVEVSDVAYIAAIWSLKQFKQTSNYRAPYIEALFDLLTAPNPNEDILGQKGMFNSVAQLQLWMTKNIAPKFEDTISSLKKIAYKTENGLHPIAIINAELLVGDVIAQRYEPTKRTHKKWILTSGHLVGLVSSLENYMGMLYYVSSYNLEKLAELSNILTKETFISIDGPTSRSEIFSKYAKRVDILSSKRVFELTSPRAGKKSAGLFGRSSKAKKDNANYRQFATLHSFAKNNINGHKDYLKASHHYFTEAAKDQLQYHIAMVESLGINGEDQLVINPVSYKASLDLSPYVDNVDVLRKSIEVLEADGPYTIEDRFIKKSYTVNLSVLFDTKKVNDLRSLLPNQFLDSRGERSPSEPKGLNWVKNNVKNWKKNFSWNYSYNKATGWPDSSFKGLLPNIKSEKQTDAINLHLLNVSSQPELPFLGLWLSMFYGY